MFDSGGFLESSVNAPTTAVTNKKTLARRTEKEPGIGMESDSDADTDLDEEWAVEDIKRTFDNSSHTSLSAVSMSTLVLYDQS
jgi:hypothetical protein